MSALHIREHTDLRLVFAKTRLKHQVPGLLVDTELLLVLLRRKIKALENPMFLGTTGERTIFQIMTRHGADIGSFSVRILTTFSAF